MPNKQYKDLSFEEKLGLILKAHKVDNNMDTSSMTTQRLEKLRDEANGASGAVPELFVELVEHKLMQYSVRGREC